MRSKTLASLIVLCASTAAFAQMTTPSTATDPTTQNNLLANDQLDNMTANEAAPEAGMETAPNTTDDQPPQL